MKFSSVLLHDQLSLTRLLIDFALCGDPFDEIFVFDIARTFANDRYVVLFPVIAIFVFLHFRAILEEDPRAKLDAKGLQWLDRFRAKQLFSTHRVIGLHHGQYGANRFYSERSRHPLHSCTVRMIHIDENTVLISNELWTDAADAIPPKWNVRIVSCVPGSPIDCAAMIPTASPMPTTLPLARLSP